MASAWITETGWLYDADGEAPRRRVRRSPDGALYAARRMGGWWYYRPTGQKDWGQQGTMELAVCVAHSLAPLDFPRIAEFHNPAKDRRFSDRRVSQ